MPVNKAFVLQGSKDTEEWRGGGKKTILLRIIEKYLVFTPY